jgi:hypothetical protein
MMTRYIVIDARAKSETVMHLNSFEDALKNAGLTPGKVDHGTIRRGLAIVVDEYGLFVPPDQQRYFAIGRHLYAGPAAVLYGFDEQGETIDVDIQYCRHGFHPLSPTRFGRWFDSIDEIEAAIAKGEIDRPVIGSSDQIIWKWPGPRPDMTPLIDKIASHEGTTIIDGDTTITTEK